MQELQTYRDEIDKIDSQIIELLAKRFGFVKKVGEYKKKNNLLPLQPARWQEVLKSKIEIGQEFGLNPEFVENLWNKIHDYALNLEKDIIYN